MDRLKKLVNRFKNIKTKKTKKLFIDSENISAVASLCSSLLLKHNSIILQPPKPRVRRIQNFVLVWLDNNIDVENDENCRNSIAKFRQIVNTVNTFTDIHECIKFISSIKMEQVFIIFSTTFAQTTIPLVHNMSQVSSIYIFDIDQIKSEICITKWQKVRGIFSEISLICEALKDAAQLCDQNSITISFVENSHGTTERNSNHLDQSFMYTQILKEIVLTMDFEQHYLKDFIRYCREVFVDNTAEFENVTKLEVEYSSHPAIWWYSYQCFLFSMLNRALRTMELDIIIKMGFFVRDLHLQIAQLHSEQYGNDHSSSSFIVYRGQGMSEKQFNRLQKSKDGLLSFNNFLSTSKNCNVSLNFARQTIATTDLVGVLFVMTIDPSLTSTPFAAISNYSYYQAEEEILFSMHSIFRIGQLQQIDNNDRLWQVELILTSDNDQELLTLTKRIREEIEGTTGRYRLGELLMKAGQFNQAEELYTILLHRTNEEMEEGNIYCQLGLIKFEQGEYTQSIVFSEKSLEIRKKLLPSSHPDLADTYNSIGVVYNKMGEFNKALEVHEKALQIRQDTLPEDHPDLAMTYNNIGFVYDEMGEYTKALSFHEKALAIYQKTLPPNHPDFATCYNNIGSVYEEMGRYPEALEFHEKAHAIARKSLPPDHPDLAASYSSHALLYDKMGDYSKALSYHKKALELGEKILSPNHPDLAMWYSNAGLMYDDIGEFSTALSFHEKALEIARKTLPKNHPDLATCYNNIGLIYVEMGEYSKALTVHEKAIEINQIALSTNHPDLATSYSNIGSVYEEMGDYIKALSFHEKALEIRQDILSPNHPDLAMTYKNIALVYLEIGEYSKALEIQEKSLKIYQTTLSPNHPDLASSYTCRAAVYDEMGEYSIALSLHEIALKIRQQTFSSTHPDVADTYNRIGLVYAEMGDYTKALSFYQDALNIYEKTLRSDHPELATCFTNIGLVYGKLGDCSKALSFHQKALEIQQATLPAIHPDIADTYNHIGLVYTDMGDYAKALSVHEEALRIYQKTFHSSHPDLATCYSDIGWVYSKMGDQTNALAFLQHAVDIGQRSLSIDHPDLLLYRKRLESLKDGTKSDGVFFF